MNSQTWRGNSHPAGHCMLWEFWLFMHYGSQHSTIQHNPISQCRKVEFKAQAEAILSCLTAWFRCLVKLCSCSPFKDSCTQIFHFKSLQQKNEIYIFFHISCANMSELTKKGKKNYLLRINGDEHRDNELLQAT